MPFKEETPENTLSFLFHHVRTQRRGPSPDPNHTSTWSRKTKKKKRSNVSFTIVLVKYEALSPGFRSLALSVPKCISFGKLLNYPIFGFSYVKEQRQYSACYEDGA